MFDLILDLMGPYIQFSMSQAIVRASTETFPGYTHTDGGEAQRAIRVTETSRPLAVKVMYLLTDVTEPVSGNFTIFLGSHLRPFPERAERIPNPHMPGAVPLLGKAGDAYAFRMRSGTAHHPDRWGKARKTILYNYCQMFMRAVRFRHALRHAVRPLHGAPAPACWATSAMISAPATSSMRRRTKWR